MSADAQIDLSAGLEPAAPPQPSGGIDLSAGLQPAAQQAPQQPQGLLARAKSYLAHGEGAPLDGGMMENLATGAGKSLLQGFAGVSQLAHDGAEHIHKGLGEYGAPQATIDQLRGAAQTHGDNQAAGAVIESVAEFMMSDGVLQGASLAEKLKAIAPVIQRLEKSPMLLKIASTAARQGAVGTAQGAAKSGSVREGESEGLLAGSLGAIAEPVATGGGKVLDYGKQVLNELRPDTIRIAGVDVPRLASQRPVPHNAPDPTVQPDATPGNTPKYAKAQQLAARQVEQNLARDAGARSIDRTYGIRAQADPGKVRPVPEDIHSEFHVPDDATPRLGDGKAPLTRVTSDPAEAQQDLSTLNDRAELGTLPPELEDARQTLEDQVKMHHAQLSGPDHVFQLDPQEAMRGVRTFREAADRLSNLHQPGWQALDQATGGEYAELRRAEVQARRVIRSSGDLDAIDRANAKLHDIEGSMSDLLAKHSGELAPGLVQSLRGGYADEMVLRKVAAMTDRATNGVSLDDELRSGGSLRKDYKGLNESVVQKLVDKDPRVAQLLGPNGVLNIKQMGSLLKEPKLREDASKLSYLVSGHLTGHFIRGGAGALLGAGAAEASGKPLTEGVIGGAAAGLGSRMVLRRLMTNPEAGRLFRFAVENRVSPKVAVPLISGALTNSYPKQEEDKP